jgi:hypothetical protein
LLVHADNARRHTAKLSTRYFNKNRMKSAPHPSFSLNLAPSDLYLSLRVCQETSCKPLIRECRSAPCSRRRCSRWQWKSDLASGLSRVDGPIKQIYRYRWGVY